MIKMIVLPKDDMKKQDVLSRIASRFKEARNYSEDEVSEIINSSDVDDYALVRRELVNFNYLGKDTAKGIYWLKKKKLSEDDLLKIRKNQERMENRGVY